jgi:hypothetical protein
MKRPRPTKKPEETSEIAEFDTMHEALDALREYLDADGIVEVHSDGCDGRSGCGCGFITLKACELMPGVKA